MILYLSTACAFFACSVLRVGYEVAASHAQLKKTLNGYDGYIHLDFTMCSLAWLHSIILCINLLCNTL